MQLDRSPGKVFDVILQRAIRRARASADQGRALLESSFPGPAYVWAVRSIEIFVKEVMLLPLFLEEIPDGDWDDVWAEAWKRIHKTFGSGNWNPAIRKIDEEYGPLDPMYTDDGADVWQMWKSVVVGRRGDVVHGRPTEAEVTIEEAAVVVEWAGQMMDQLIMRLVNAGKHPLHDLVVEALDAARPDANTEDHSAT